MLSSDLVEPILGGVIGFGLGQVANLVVWLHARWYRPVLSIEVTGPRAVLLSHSTQTEHEGFCEEEIYGFSVRNTGRSISHRVRFQLFKVECRKNGVEEYWPLSEATFSLAAYNQSSTERGPTEVTLVPGATVVVLLASWIGDHHDMIIPAVSSLPEYYEEACSGVGDFKFGVVVFDETARFTKRDITVQTEDVLKQIESGEWMKPTPPDEFDIFAQTAPQNP